MHEIKLETARKKAFDFEKAFDNYDERKANTAEDFLQLMEKPTGGYGKNIKRRKK
ncbi:MAG: hypothetical protein LLG37_04420 [Spirochaetia bacterium]|nr:hypothetical protein [Spirochaetia bacterium]